MPMDAPVRIGVIAALGVIDVPDPHASVLVRRSPLVSR